MGIFLQVVLPIISVFIIGYLLQMWKKLDVKPVSAVTIYVFIPFLVFQAFMMKILVANFPSLSS
ncbi:hypothetical protein [Piscibacillus salipiscarius]|uniref:hypothetical protein n=1 Tax=Piscibacillus salipiscarius TaxID=299480 RepID=UPI0024365223|nr:hypothetical protein [Piscibacillus salipiscarius]